MCRWLNSKGEVIETRTIRDFAERYGMSVGVARQLHSGQRARMNGFCSTAKRAKRRRDRFTTVLVHSRTGQRRIVGPSVRQLADETGLCLGELHKLICERKIMYKGWCLLKTWEAANGAVADNIC